MVPIGWCPPKHRARAALFASTQHHCCQRPSGNGEWSLEGRPFCCAPCPVLPTLDATQSDPPRAKRNPKSRCPGKWWTGTGICRICIGRWSFWAKDLWGDKNRGRDSDCPEGGGPALCVAMPMPMPRKGHKTTNQVGQHRDKDWARKNCWSKSGCAGNWFDQQTREDLIFPAAIGQLNVLWPSNVRG